MRQALSHEWRPHPSEGLGEAKREEAKHQDGEEQEEGSKEEQRRLRLGKLLKGILEGINYIHSVGVMHCDLKPQNVLVNERGDAVLADFETSKHFRADGAALGADNESFTFTRSVVVRSFFFFFQ